MAFKLPKLTTDIDCGPIGYPGLVVRFNLNPGFDPYAFPWANIDDEEKRDKEREKSIRVTPWLAEFWYNLGRIVAAVVFPPEMTTSGQEETVELDGAEDVYSFMRTKGFEQNIIIWAAGQYHKQAQARLRAELKNSEAASGEPGMPSERARM